MVVIVMGQVIEGRVIQVEISHARIVELLD